MPASDAAIRFHEFVLDPARRVLERDGAPVDLQPKVFDTLLVLARSPERVLSKDDLFARVWPDTVVSDDALTRVVRELRKALDDDARSPRFVQAVRGVGYQFIAPVERAGGSVRRTVAVLPFRAITSDSRDESLELGMTDTLIARLSTLPELVVRPLDAVRSHREGDDAQGLARELGVEAFVEGSLQTSGDRIRVNVRLISTEDGTSLWSGTFDERFAEVFAVQDAISARVVDRLLPHLSDPVAAVAPVSRPPEEAYRDYLEGRLFYGRETPADIRRAMVCFERALQNAPDYVDALVALGQCHDRAATEGEVDAADNYIAVRRLARRALELCPGLPEAECLLGKVAWRHDWDWPAADAAFERALVRGMNRVDVRTAYSDYLIVVGREEEALAHARAAFEMDPVSPWTNIILAQGLYHCGRYRDAVEQAERTLELVPGYQFGHLFAGLAEVARGNHEAGIAHIESAARSGRRDIVSAVALCYGRAGRVEEARGILERLRTSDAPPPIAIAVASFGCGEVDAAVECLEECFQRKHWHMLLISWDPFFAEIREEPRVRRLIERLELPPRPGDGKPSSPV